MVYEVLSVEGSVVLPEGPRDIEVADGRTLEVIVNVVVPAVTVVASY